MASERKSLGTRLYDTYSALVGTVTAMVSPGRAARFRWERDMYRTYTSGEASGNDRNFRPVVRSGDAEVKRAYKLTVARCRDQAQNNPQVAGAIERTCANVIREGIYPLFKFKTQDNKLDRVINGRWQSLFTRWARYCDNTGHDSLGSLQKLILRHMWTDGQCFIHRVYDDSLKGIVPLRLELLEADQLDVRVDGVQADGHVARRGIKYHRESGRPFSFCFLDQHPGDYLHLGNGSTREIPAEDIIHVWDRRRISQFSGISWLAAVVMEAYRMDEFRHTTQDAARLQSIMIGFLQSSIPGFAVGSGMPAGGQSTPYTPASTGAKDTPKEFTPNSIQSLPTGTSLDWSKPTHPGTTYEPFVKDSGRMQSTGLGMSFEAYTNNYTDSSYASARSGSLEERLSYRSQQQLIEEKTNRRLNGWFMDAAVLSRLAPITMLEYSKDPLLYQEMAEGQRPGWGWVDPRNDAMAAEKLLQLTLGTRRRQAAERGNNWDSDMDDLMEEELRLIEYAKVKQKRLTLEEGSNAE